jgi:hypothetical protein
MFSQNPVCLHSNSVLADACDKMGLTPGFAEAFRSQREWAELDKAGFQGGTAPAHRHVNVSNTLLTQYTKIAKFMLYVLRVIRIFHWSLLI